MKTSKKITALLVALVLMFALSVPAFALEEEASIVVTFNIGPGAKKTSNDYYYTTKDVDVLYVSDLTWSPANESIKVILVNATTGSITVLQTYTGGKITYAGLGNIPTGAYYVGVLNQASTTLTGSMTFEWIKAP